MKISCHNSPKKTENENINFNSAGNRAFSFCHRPLPGLYGEKGGPPPMQEILTNIPLVMQHQPMRLDRRTNARGEGITDRATFPAGEKHGMAGTA